MRRGPVLPSVSRLLPYQRLTGRAAQRLKVGKQAVHPGGANANQMHRVFQLPQKVRGDFPIRRMGQILLRKGLHQPGGPGDLQPVELAEALVPVVDGQGYVGVFRQAGELSAALREHPEAAVVPAVLNRGAAHIAPGAGGQGAGVVGLEVRLDHGPQPDPVQLDALRVLFLPVAGRRPEGLTVVRGYIVSDAPDEIVVNIDIEMGGYLFE